MIKNDQKIKEILRISGMSQDSLARKIGVSFPALNAWVNNRAKPRTRHLDKIEKLYLEYTGQKVVSQIVLSEIKKELSELRDNNKNILKKILSRPDLHKEFILGLTYNSNKIEGSTLSEPETAAILFDGAVLPNKTQVEQLEVQNHEEALRHLFAEVNNNSPINEEMLLTLHGKLLNAIMPDAGTYRRQGVRIMGANVPTANYLSIPELMKKLFRDYNLKSKDSIGDVAKFHARFEQIHPFSDGNGRVGRLLLVGMLLAYDYPPAIIKNSERSLYYAYLNRAQTRDDSSALEEYISIGIREAYNLILN